MKIPPRRKTRLLRSFTRMAFKDHGNCPTCRKPIQAGEEYDCDIEVVTLGKQKFFHVSKCHRYCPWEPDDDPQMELPVEEHCPVRIAA